MLKVTNIRVRSFDINYLEVFWDIESTFEDVNDYVFVVERGNSEFGPWVDATGEFRNKFHLRDNLITNKYDMYIGTYYRIRVKKVSDSSAQIYPTTGNGVKLGAKPDLECLEMARQFKLKLREYTGRKVWVFPRKKFGQKCGCYDRVTGRKLRSQCLTCFDTGFVGGYDSPVETYAQIHSPAESTNKTVAGTVTSDDTAGLFGNFPELFDGYVIVEAENLRWRVGSPIDKKTKAKATIRQVARLHHIPLGDIEYNLPMNIDDISNLEASPARNYTNPQTLSSTAVVDAALGIYK